MTRRPGRKSRPSAKKPSYTVTLQYTEPDGNRRQERIASDIPNRSKAEQIANSYTKNNSWVYSTKRFGYSIRKDNSNQLQGVNLKPGSQALLNKKTPVRIVQIVRTGVNSRVMVEDSKGIIYIVDLEQLSNKK